MLSLISCDKSEQLKSPDGLKVDAATLLLEWSNIAGARIYTVSVTDASGEEKESIVSKSYYSLTQLAEGTYTVKVKANGKEGVSRDSEWSEPITFVREHENGLVYTLINNNTEYEVSSKGTATGEITIPDTYRGLPVTQIGKKAFFNKSDLTKITFGKNVKTICDFAFGNCSYLTELTLPEGLVSIGENAFASCRLIAGEVVIPEGVTVIPRNAFAYCGSIESLRFGSKLERIDKLAFTDCRKLTSITLPDSLRSVGEHAFAMCEGLVSLDLGSGIKEIGKYAFSADKSLESVVIPDSVKVIYEGAFFECESLASITLGTGIEEIDMGAFASTPVWKTENGDNCVYVGRWFLGLKDTTAAAVDLRADTVGIANFALYGNKSVDQIIIPNSVKRIGTAAFAASALTSVVIGSGVEILGEQAFASCEKLSTAILGSFDINGLDAKIEFSSLETISDYAFYECKLLGSIEMPDSLKTVGSQVFRESGIYTLAEGVVYADGWVVDYNDKIGASVELKTGTVGIANYAFYNCTALTSITMPTSVKTVGRAAFYDCSSLSHVELPGTLEVIEDYTFYRCKSLQLFSLPPLLKSIGRSAFYKCGTAVSVKDTDTENDVLVIPVGVTSIGDFAFYSCGFKEKADISDAEYFNYYGIDKIVIGENTVSIGASAFYGFLSLKTLELGGVKEIGEKAFYKCPVLTSVDFGDQLESIGIKAFYKCEALASADLPKSLTSVGDYAFYKCTALESVDLGCAESIGAFAFYGDAAITELSLPVELTFIGRQAFRNCRGLTAVMIATTVTEIDKHAFYGCSSLTVYTEADKALDSWHKHWNSSYRPVIFGCEFSEDNSYVLYIVKSDVSNLNATNKLSDPKREGYTFAGWGSSATASVAAFTSENLSDAENGRKLYAIWVEE